MVACCDVITVAQYDDRIHSSYAHCGFFVGWPNPPSDERLKEILSRSHLCYVAVNCSKQSIVGFITSISDGILTAYVPLLEVHPDYQKQGIGKKLVKRLFEELNSLYMIDLICDENVLEFYKKALDNKLIEGRGISIRNYERQAG